MSTIKVNNLQVGTSATGTQNFTVTAPLDGTLKLARGNQGATTQDVMTVGTNGKVAFPAGLADFEDSNQGLTSNGSQKMPGGLLLQWGRANLPVASQYSASATITFPLPFSDVPFSVVANLTSGGTSTTGVTLGIRTQNQTKNDFFATLDTGGVPNLGNAVQVSINWFAVGRWK